VSVFHGSHHHGMDVALTGGSAELWNVIYRHHVSSGDNLYSLPGIALGVPAGFLMGALRFPRHGDSRSRSRTPAMAVPPVVIGLVVMMVLSRRGPLGSSGLLYSVNAMSIAQTLISDSGHSGPHCSCCERPCLTSCVYRRARLGASQGPGGDLLALKEARLGVLAAVATGFGAVVRGVGAVMMVGGNIEGQARACSRRP
jgi:tungstate transport system permease protein